MSEYLPSFIVEPVLRQARRFSRLSTGEEAPSPGFLPAVPDLQRWNPTRFWNTSPPPSLEEQDGETQETRMQSITRSIQLWASQLNSFDQIPSPPLEPLETMDESAGVAHGPTGRFSPAVEFPSLGAETLPSARPALRDDQRTGSDTSMNPAHELPSRSRRHQDSVHNHPRSLSDPLAVGRTTGEEQQAATQQNYTNGYERRDGSGALPEDDGMGPLRQKITAIWSGPGTPAEKSRLVHTLMMEGYSSAQPYRPAVKMTLSSGGGPDFLPRPGTSASTRSGASHEVVFNLTPADLLPTYAPVDPEATHDALESSSASLEPDLGCVHYKRNVKMQCATCERWYTCRLCHDEAESHTLPRRETRHMLCMLCKTPQAASQICKSCNVQAACYYCAVCKLWNNDPQRSIYHCDDCGICRLGEGLGKDFFHCNTCAACMSIQAESTHKCIERSTKCDCPICGEYMFTSNKPVAFMRCGHGIHESCFAEWCNASYKCPICSKSIANMESQFRRLDRHIEEQPMPEEYRDNRAFIFCNDCNSRSVTKYHWLGLKCSICDSYNTTQLELLGAEDTPQLQAQQAEAQQQNSVSEAMLTASQTHTPTNELVSQPPVDIANPTPTRSINTAVTVGSPQSHTSWLMPHTPTSRSVRSVSPVVGSYFGTGSRRESATPRIDTSVSGSATQMEVDDDDDDEDDVGFWGTPTSPRRAEQEESDSSSEDEVVEEEESDEEDFMDLMGHR